MSEYQYYEFLAIDHTLAPKQIDEIRAISTRAEITSNSFVNEYHWGNFKGNPEQFVTKYFDVMLYYANWGTHRLLIGLPADQVDVKLLEQFAGDEGVSVKTKSGRVLIDFVSDTEDEEWYEDDEEFAMATMSGVREEILRGDLRAIYLGWLSGLWPDADDDDLEPTVPAGLNKLSPAQKALAAFLRVDRDLLDVATQNSADLTIDESGLTKWVASLPVSEKDKLLIAAARGELANVGLELSRRFATARPRSPGEAQPRRRVVDLTSRARVVREQREEQERLARQAKRAREQAKRDAERKKYLAQLSARKHHAWNEIDQLILQKQKSTYDQAVTLLCDLKELAVQEQALEQFESRVRALRDAHRNKSVLMSKLDLKLPRINLSA